MWGGVDSCIVQTKMRLLVTLPRHAGFTSWNGAPPVTKWHSQSLSINTVPIGLQRGP